MGKKKGPAPGRPEGGRPGDRPLHPQLYHTLSLDLADAREDLSLSLTSAHQSATDLLAERPAEAVGGLWEAIKLGRRALRLLHRVLRSLQAKKRIRKGGDL